MSESKAREAAFAALYPRHSLDNELDANEPDFATFCAAIDAYIAARREQGFVEVPREPTEAMIAAADDVLFQRADIVIAQSVWPDMYRAMLNAAEQHTGEK